MESKAVPEDLLALRDKIDAIDEQLIELLSRRFEVTKKVGEVKARNKLESVDAGREREKLDRLRLLAEMHSLNGQFVVQLFQAIFDEVVENHKRLLT